MKLLKSASAAACVVCALAMGAPSAGAITFDVTALSYEWTNVMGGSNVTNNGLKTTTDTASIRWGGTDSKSGYDFTGTSVPFMVDDGVMFELGEFTHINEIIPSGTAITSADLDVNVTFDGQMSTFEFQFLHDETPNACEGPNCADDLVDVVRLVTSDTFMIDGVEYTLNILGFSTDGGTTITEQFRSPEGGSNMAALIAEFSVAPIPVPAAGWMFLTGLAGLGWFGRRRHMRKKKAAAAA